VGNPFPVSTFKERTMYTLSKTALHRLLEQILDKINPDILHPHVPFVLDAAARVALNPQPLPPKAQAALGAFLARAMIDQAEEQLRIAMAVSGGENVEKIVGAIGSHVAEDVDFVCGNGLTPWPLPWPWPPKFGPGEIAPADLLFAGAQFQTFADDIGGNPLRGVFSKAADQFFSTALKRLEGACECPAGN
jgi:hypothetical protein